MNVEFSGVGTERQIANLDELNSWLAKLSAPGRLAWALEKLPTQHAVSSSFGAQSAALLHMAQNLAPAIPVIFVDTLYLFPETYVFAQALQERLKLNVVRVEPEASLRYGEAQVANLDTAGLAAIEHYNRVHKVQPMQNALKALGVGTWIAGLRRQQARSREQTAFLSLQNGRCKFHPIADWTDRDIGRYLTQHDLPYHPLWEKGFVSIGDRYLTQALEPGMDAEQTRFFGLKRECGLHQYA